MARYEGRPDGEGRRVCVVVSRFNQMVTARLEEEAVRRLEERGVEPDAVDVLRVPGAWELTPAVRRARGRGYDAIVALGCLIRGETPHFDYICQATAGGLTALNREEGPPISFGVLTTENLAQAMARAGGDAGNLGASAADAALEMADLFRRLAEDR